MAMVLAGPAEGDTPITVTPAIAAAAAAVANLEMRRITSPSQMNGKRFALDASMDSNPLRSGVLAGTVDLRERR